MGFPNNLGLPNISPVLKKENAFKKGNYRPLLLGVLSGHRKIFKRMMENQISGYLKNYLVIFIFV